MSKLKILIINTPECAYHKVLLDLLSDNDFLEAVVIPEEEFYNVGTPGHIDHGKSVIASMFNAISEANSLVFHRELLTNQDIKERFYGKSIVEMIAEAGQSLDEKELPVDYIGE